MNNDAETLDSETLLRDYQVAVIGFNAATAILIHHLAASTLPTEREISAEENARAAVIAARERLWDTYRKA